MTEVKHTGPLTVAVELPAATVSKLRAKAETAGQPLESYIAALANLGTDDTPQPDLLAEAVKKLTTRTPDQVLADRATVLATARRGRALPAGKTLFDVVEGTWPGDESDAEIQRALERLS